MLLLGAIQVSVAYRKDSDEQRTNLALAAGASNVMIGSWFAGTPDDLVAHLKAFEERYPGMQHINLSPPLTTPKDRIVEQYRMVGELVMPHFRVRPAVQAAAAK